MKMQTTKIKWICVPVLLTGVLGFGCRDNKRVTQPSVSVPNSTASTTTSMPSTTPALSGAMTTATDSSLAASNSNGTTNANSNTNVNREVAANKSTDSKSSTTPASLNDMQIADVVKAVNDAEIGAGTLAKTRAENPQVRAYAKKMIDEHSKNNLKAKAILVKKSDAIATENEVSKAMRADTATQLSKLQNMSGSAFDQAYIDEQVKMHKQLLSDLDNNYIPAAKDAKLKEYLKETRKHVNQHLQGAQQVLTMINSGI